MSDLIERIRDLEDRLEGYARQADLQEPALRDMGAIVRDLRLRCESGPAARTLARRVHDDLGTVKARQQRLERRVADLEDLAAQRTTLVVRARSAAAGVLQRLARRVTGGVS